MLCTFLAFDGQCIDIFTSKSIKCGNHVGADTLVGLSMKVSKVQVAAINGAVFIRTWNRWRVGHHFHTTGNAKVIHAAHQVCRCDVDGGNT